MNNYDDIQKGFSYYDADNEPAEEGYVDGLVNMLENRASFLQDMHLKACAELDEMLNDYDISDDEFSRRSNAIMAVLRFSSDQKSYEIAKFIEAYRREI